jgi:exodeoxyribonuclease VII large subunit
VVSAVGHEIDVTLSDLVADVRALTPSEAAELVIPSAEELATRLATFQRRIVSMLRSRAVAARRHVEQLTRSRVLRNPKALIYDRARRLDELDGHVERAIRRQLKSARERLSAIASRAEALSPLAVLARGYSVTTREADDKLILGADELAAGDRVLTRLSRGQFRGVVTETD